MKLIRQLIVFFIPVFLAVSFPLTLYGKNLGQVPTGQIVIPLLCVICGAIGVAWITKSFLHDQWKSIVVSCVTIIVFFTYTDVFSLVSQSFIVQVLPRVSPSFELAIHSLLGIVLLSVVIHNIKKNMDYIIPFVGVFSVCSFVLSLFPIVDYLIRQRVYMPTSHMEIPKVAPLVLEDQRPDIYYIVPDSHTSPRVMKEQFGYDMTGFVKTLEDSGFHFFYQSTSNYPKTLLSLSSSLNMEYLGYLSTLSSSTDETLMYPLIENNTVLKFLKQLGYSYYQLGSWWEGTKINRGADKNILADNEYLISITGFTYALMSTTLLRPFITEYPQVFLGETNQEKLQRTQFQFTKVEDVTRLPGPKFVFFHIIAPHPPYLFDNNCVAVESTDYSMQASQINYVEQAECIDKKLVTMIETIQNTSSHSAVIILQSDEGVDFYDGKDRWDRAPTNELQRKFPILHALCLPGIDVSHIPETLTPVNIFRVVFNSYFHTNLPLLPDKNYIWKNDHVYDFIEVTDTVQSGVLPGVGK